MSKLFVFEYDNGCDYTSVKILIAKTEKDARDFWKKKRYEVYLGWVNESPKNPRDAYHVPFKTMEEWEHDEDSPMCEDRTLDEYKLVSKLDLHLPMEDRVIYGIGGPE